MYASSSNPSIRSGRCVASLIVQYKGSRAAELQSAYLSSFTDPYHDTACKIDLEHLGFPSTLLFDDGSFELEFVQKGTQTKIVWELQKDSVRARGPSSPHFHGHISVILTTDMQKDYHELRHAVGAANALKGTMDDCSMCVQILSLRALRPTLRFIPCSSFLKYHEEYVGTQLIFTHLCLALILSAATDQYQSSPYQENPTDDDDHLVLLLLRNNPPQHSGLPSIHQGLLLKRISVTLHPPPPAPQSPANECPVLPKEYRSLPPTLHRLHQLAQWMQSGVASLRSLSLPLIRESDLL